MALYAKVHFRVKRQVFREVGSVQLVATHASKLFTGARVDNVAPDRMRALMSVSVTFQTEIHARLV